jgi:hypothetical protein
MAGWLALGAIGALVAGLVGLETRLHRRHLAAETKAATWRAAPGIIEAVYPRGSRCEVWMVGAARPDRRAPCLLFFGGTHLGIDLQERDGTFETGLDIQVDELRWFGRPQKYDQVFPRNELWLHVERANRWMLVKIKRLHYGDALRLVRALKQIAPPEIVTAYRRQRPYIHVEPVFAQRAEQDIYGAWTLHEPLRLYLMPLHLVRLNLDWIVADTIPLATITQVAAVRRMDAPGGVVRFRSGDATLAYALDDYPGLALALAEAAKRSLEAPPEFLGVKKKAEE